MNKQYLSIFLLILATFFWGTTFVLVKQTVAIVGIDGFLSIRFLLAFGVMLLLMGVSSPEEVKAIRQYEVLKYSFILGTLLFFSFWFQTIGLSLTTPSKAAFITGLNVILIPIFIALPPYKRPVSRVELVASVIALLGLLLMTFDFDDYIIHFGDLIIILTAICIAYHVIITERAIRHNVNAIVTYQLGFVGVWATVFAIINGNVWIPTDLTLPAIVWATLFVTAILATAYAMWSQTYAQKQKIPPSTIAVIFTMEPVFALVIDILLGVIPAPIVFTGMAMILVSSYMAITSIAKVKKNSKSNVDV